jgi:hypothetical protein
MKHAIFSLLLISLLFSSCETEVDLNAPYQNTTVIFGLLDPDSNGDNVISVQDTQWIKINKTFLGEGDNNNYAAIRDSSEYSDDDFVKKVVERIVDGDVVEEYELKSITVGNRQMNGIFYGPEQTLYYFTPSAPGLNQTSEYRIVLQFTDGREVSAVTNVVNFTGFGWNPPASPNTTLIMASQNFANGDCTYQDQVQVKWDAVENASIYQVTLRFHFTELIYLSEDYSVAPIDTNEKYLDYPLGFVKADDQESELKITFDGLGFFNFLRNSLTADNKIRRKIGVYNDETTSPPPRTECFDLFLTCGNKSFEYYIDVNTPSAGIVQERPVYTNVVNGLGLFASRTGQRRLGMPLILENTGAGGDNIGNLWALSNCDLLSALNFCDPNPTSQFSCID